MYFLMRFTELSLGSQTHVKMLKKKTTFVAKEQTNKKILQEAQEEIRRDSNVCYFAYVNCVGVASEATFGI